MVRTVFDNNGICGTDLNAAELSFVYSETFDNSNGSDKVVQANLRPGTQADVQVTGQTVEQTAKRPTNIIINNLPVIITIALIAAAIIIPIAATSIDSRPLAGDALVTDSAGNKVGVVNTASNDATKAGARKDANKLNRLLLNLKYSQDRNKTTIAVNGIELDDTIPGDISGVYPNQDYSNYVIKSDEGGVYGLSAGGLIKIAGKVFDFVISPDGSKVVYTCTSGMYLFSISESIESKKISEDESFQEASFSQDGNTLVYRVSGEISELESRVRMVRLV